MLLPRRSRATTSTATASTTTAATATSSAHATRCPLKRTKNGSTAVLKESGPVRTEALLLVRKDIRQLNLQGRKAMRFKEI